MMCSLLSRSIGPTHGRPCNVGGLEDVLSLLQHCKTRPRSRAVPFTSSAAAMGPETTPGVGQQLSVVRASPCGCSGSDTGFTFPGSTQDRPPVANPVGPCPKAVVPLCTSNTTMPAGPPPTSTSARPPLNVHYSACRDACVLTCTHVVGRHADASPHLRVTSRAGQSRPVRLHASSLPSSPWTSSWPSGARESFVVHRLVGAGTGARSSGA